MRAGLAAWLLSMLLFGCGTEARVLPMMVEAGCDAAAGPCGAEGEALSIRFRLGAPVRPLSRFDIELVAEGPSAGRIAQVEVWFEMADMDMGLNRYRLDARGKGRWTGAAMLPVCTSGRSDWRARVRVAEAQRTYEAVFPFRVKGR
ncbi:hypothetical protein [Thiohalobacter sp.]|uniref:hypothetical protein n=1 Tax=Thiohalobacter sp. TaxID=2025948 RepID=UPI00262723E2|nr:hypothetical protein [Thiohalobacter sp.]